ncbi:MAG: phosphotransferase family protein [Myxococcota bacterium]
MGRVDSVNEIESRLTAYLLRQLPGARDLSVEGLERIHGGASRETYRFRLRYQTGDGRVERRLILRRDPPGSLIDTQRATEFAAYRAFFATSVPVPEPLWLEEDPGILGHPFFVMVELPGLTASPQALQVPPYSEHLEKIGERKWAILGEISRADPEKLGLLATFERVSVDGCWRRELDYWEGVIDSDELHPQPVIRAAIRWLRRNPPPPAQKLSVVHGDYRTGNFLYDTDGEIRGILDWEMAHLGDPLEDLAWGINRVWCWARDERVGGLLPRERAVEIWQRASGLRADPAGLLWWELFSSVKAQAIWISSRHEYLEGANQDPVLGLSGWWLANAQDRAALETLGRLT